MVVTQRHGALRQAQVLSSSNGSQGETKSPGCSNRVNRLDAATCQETLSIIIKTATVADLRNDFASISKWIHEGEAVTITKRGLPFASLAPARKQRKLPPVDRLAHLQKLFPKGPINGNSREVVDYDRCDR